MGIRVFGEFEFWFCGIKVIALVGLIMMGFKLIIDLGGNPQHDRIGFRYWNPPNGPLGYYLISQVHNKHLSQFLDFWSTCAESNQENVFCIVVFYIGGTFVISLTVPSTNNVSCYTLDDPPLSPCLTVPETLFVANGSSRVSFRGQ